MAVGTATLVVAGAVAAGTATAKYLSDRKKRKEAQKAAKKAQKAAEKQRQENISGAEANAQRVGEGYERAKQTITDYANKAKEAYAAGDKAAGDIYKQKALDARAQLKEAYGSARDDLSGGYSKARDAGSKGFADARSTLDPLAALSHYGEDAITGKGFEESGGYKFRLSEGQQALDRANAASGGRLSGAALKRASQYNQGFASNEYNTWADRASALGRVGYNATGQISDLQGREGQFLADTYAREGAGLSELDVAKGSALAGIDMSEAGYLSGLEQNAGTRLGNLESALGSNLASLETGSANNQANIRTGAGAQNNSLTMALMPSYSAGAQYAGAGWDALGQGLGTFGQIFAYGQGSGWGSGSGSGSLPADAQYVGGGNQSILNDAYGTPYAPIGYYK